MPNTKNISVKYNRENSKLNLIAAGCGVGAIAVTFIFPGLIFLPILLGAASAGVWGYSAYKTGKYANKLEKQQTIEENTKVKPKRSPVELSQNILLEKEQEEEEEEQKKKHEEERRWRMMIQKQEEEDRDHSGMSH